MNIKRKKKVDANEFELTEKVVKINRVAKVVKGGRRFSFNAMSAVGDGYGHVGVGFGKANEVPDAIRKSIDSAKKDLAKVEIKKNTIPHEVVGRFKTTKVLLKPAYPGTGIKASDVVRSVVELAGIHDIITKVYGSRNHNNVLKATFDGLINLRNHFEVAQNRDIPISQLWGQPVPPQKGPEELRLEAEAEAESDVGQEAQAEAQLDQTESSEPEVADQSEVSETTADQTTVESSEIKE